MKYQSSFRVKLLVIAIAIFFYATDAHSTLVVPALEEKELGQAIKLIGSFNSAKTSVQRTRYSASVNWNYGRNGDHFMAFGNLSYGDVDDKKYLDKHLFHLRYIRYNVARKYRAEVFIQQEKNELASLNSRSLVGTGISRLFGEKNEEFTYHLMLGLMYEEEIHSSISELNRTNTRFSLSNQLEWKLFENSVFTLTNYIQPKATDLDNYRFIIDGALSVPLNEKITLSLGANFRRYTEAYIGIPQNTNAVQTSITYQF